jgi:VWFA-related protein
MRLTSFRPLLVCALLVALIVPAGQMSASGQQASPQPPPPAQQQNPQQPNFSISVTVPVVNVDVVVTDDEGNYLPGLKKENFRILEDGAPQAITNFSTGDAPITVVLLLEYSRLAYGYFLYNARNWADVFLHQLKPNDWVALESFSLRTNVEVDFTHNPSEVEQGLIQMSLPPFTEANLFDAVGETVDRLRDVKGRKSILVLASGIDTFSALTLGKIVDKLKESDVTINCVGVNQQGNQTGDGLAFFQSQNQLKSFSTITGGRAWFPRFEGEIPGIMQDVSASLRNQYSLAYTPTNQNTDGKYRKIKVELVAEDGSPLTVLDQKGKKHKYTVYARQGYTAPTGSVN